MARLKQGKPHKYADHSLRRASIQCVQHLQLDGVQLLLVKNVSNWLDGELIISIVCPKLSKYDNWMVNNY